MEKESALAFEYLNAILHKTWATYAFPYPRFGYLTSNLSESINSAWKDLRHFFILKMVDTIYKRYHEPQKNNILCNIPYAMCVAPFISPYPFPTCLSLLLLIYLYFPYLA